MTFPELMVKARRRLHDLRASNGSIITSATVDGIRWTADHLEDVTKSGVLTLIRTLQAYDLKEHVNLAVQYRFVGCEIDIGTAYGIVKNLPTDLYKILRLQPSDGTIYDYLEPEAFFSKRWRMRDYADASDIDIEERWFTMVYNAPNKKLMVYTLPIPASTITNVQAIVVIPLETLYTKTSTTALPFISLEDLLLDFVEREGRHQEGNANQVKFLTELINMKIQGLANEVQRDFRQDTR